MPRLWSSTTNFRTRCWATFPREGNETASCRRPGRDDDRADQANSFLTLEIQSESLAFIQHSAGTTGLQKGVALTHAAVLRQLRTSCPCPEDRRRHRPHLQLAAALPRHGTDRLLHVAHGLPHSGCDAVAAGLGDASGDHAADHQRVRVHAGVDAELCLSIRASADARRTPWAQYDLSSVRALINCSEPVRANSMPEFQRAFSASGLKDSAAAFVLCHGGECFRRDAIESRSTRWARSHLGGWSAISRRASHRSGRGRDCQAR